MQVTSAPIDYAAADDATAGMIVLNNDEDAYHDAI